MSSEKDLLELEQNVHRESMKDGLQELLMALMLCFSGIVLVDGRFVIFLAILVVFQTTAVEKFREAYTYPRLGKFKLRDEKQQTSGTGFLLTLVPLLILLSLMILAPHLGLSYLDSWLVWAPAAFGLVFVGPSLYLVRKSGLERYHGLAGLAVVLGLVFSQFTFPTPLDRLVLYLFSLAGTIALVGVIILARFLSIYPVLITEDPTNGSQ